MTTTEDCYSCRTNGKPPAELPSRERVFDDGQWRVAHSFSSALPGWMVVVARRHVTSMGQLTGAEGAALGLLLVALSRALERAVDASKTYVAMFAEAEGFEHLHVHVVPRRPDQPKRRRGPRVFGYLRRPADDWVPAAEMDRVADQVRPLLAEELRALSA
jgi:diadenosine tetraphosphate (Ap4A) HIT family hydrolase